MVRELALLLVILAMGIVGRNSLVTWSAVGLIVLKVAGFGPALVLLDRWGIHVGLTILTLTVLLPFATGESGPDDVAHALSGLKGAASLTAGIVAAWLGARGLNALSGNPEIITGVLVGTVIGTLFFRGMPVGPLVAVGMAVVIFEFVGS